MSKHARRAGNNVAVRLPNLAVRLHADYEFSESSKLTDRQRSVFVRECESEFGGILRPRRPGLMVRAISEGAVPMMRDCANGTATFGLLRDRQLQDAVVRLVLDGVMEIEVAGSWVTGPVALPYLSDLPEPSDEMITGSIARLSWAAVKYGTELGEQNPSALARRLYCYNRLAAAAHWTSQFPTSEALRDRLAGGPLSDTSRTLAANWKEVEPPANNDRWRVFVARHRAAPAAARALPFKLYISPTPQAFITSFPVIVDSLARAGVRCFKVADDLYGMLRPDKFMVYLPTRDSVDRLAGELMVPLRAVPAHGVPFTADLFGDGLMSWGIDPPHVSRDYRSGAASWRAWVTLRLAWFLSTARRLGTRGPLWRYALSRISLDGIDITTWAPSTRQNSNSPWEW